MMEASYSSRVFRDVRFVLFGFNPDTERKIRLKLVNGGGVDVRQYSGNCTHVIVDKIVYDDPVCVSARKDGKTLVTALWVEHSADIGMPVDATSVMYRPLKDLNGIPGAKDLIVCLTGYLRQDRDDIMTMVGLMGAQFSKPLVAHKVTHLICYKFEGEKYELAKRLGTIKLINHRWLEDCLKEWVLLPEDKYIKSGFELEMMGEEAKDSEEEAEDSKLGQSGGRNRKNSPPSLKFGIATSNGLSKSVREASNAFPHSIGRQPLPQVNNGEDLLTIPRNKDKSDQDPSFHIVDETKITGHAPDLSKHSGSCHAGNANSYDLHDDSSKSKKLASDLRLNSASPAGGVAHSNEKLRAMSYSRKNQKGFTLPRVLDECLGREGNSTVNSSSKVEKVREEVNNSGTCLFSKHAASTFNSVAFDEPFSRNAASESAHCDNVYQNSPQMPVQCLSESKINGKHDIIGSGMQQVDHNEAEQHNVTIDIGSSPGNKSQNEESSGRTNLDLRKEESKKLIRKSPQKKSVAKKSLGSKPKEGAVGQKKSISLNKTTSEVKAVIFSNGSKEIATCVAKNQEGSPQTVGVNKTTEQEKVSEYAEDAGGRTDILDDETEAPDDKCEYELGMAALEEDSVLPKKVHTASEEKSVPISRVKKCEEEMPPKKDINKTENQKPSSVVDSTSKLEVKHQASKRPAGKRKKTTVPKENLKSDEAISRKKIPNETGQEPEIETMEEMSLPATKTDISAVPKRKSKNFIEEKENTPLDGEQDIVHDRSDGNTTTKSSIMPAKTNSRKLGPNSCRSEPKARVKAETICFILSGHRLQRKEFKQVIKRLKGRLCRDSHQWSYQATHFVAPDPIRRTEKFFAAAASGRWILKTDFLTASNQAGKFLPEEPYEWHKNGLSEDGAINMEAPRKWRLLKERTGHGALYGMRILVYGDFIAPPLDTLKRVMKAGDGTILATSPPYTRFLGTEIDYAIVSPSMPRVDMWIQEFLKYEIPCVVADYLVEYVCKPGFSLERHVLYGTQAWAERSFAKLQSKAEEVIEELIASEDTNNDDDIICQVCGSRDRGDVMLICGDESGSVGCGVGTHIDCCDPPLTDIPEEDWFCPKCSSTRNCSKNPSKRRKGALSLSKSK